MSIETFYIGQCVDWRFPFTLPDGSPPDLMEYDAVDMHFRCGATLKTASSADVDGVAVSGNIATFHSDAEFLDTAGEWQLQAWAYDSEHQTPSKEVRRFLVVAGVPPAPTS